MDFMERTHKNYEQLTKGLKKVAEAVITDPVPFATHPAKKVAALIDVSESMVIRFCRAIGFEGYSDFQENVQQSLLSIQNGVFQTNNPQSSSYERIMNMDQQIINQTIPHINWETAANIVDELVKTKSIKVVGYYHSFSYAHWFSFLLNHLLENTHLYRPESDMSIGSKGPEHCVVIFSYYRYALEAIRIAEEAHNNGNKVIIITDSKLSPATKYGTHILTIQVSQKSILEKGPVTFSVLNTLLLHIAEKVGKLQFVNPTNKYYIQ